MTLSANEIGILLSTIDFKIQRAAIVKGLRDVAPFSPATRADRHFHRPGIDGAER